MNWLALAKYGIPLLIVGVAVWCINDRAYERGKGAAELVCSNETVPAAKAAVQKVCDANSAITKGACDALQTRLDNISGRYQRVLAASKSAKCLPVTSSAGRSDGGTKGDVPAVQLGISTDWLAERFNNADTFTAVGLTCQEVLCGIYKANGQGDKLPAGACATSK